MDAKKLFEIGVAHRDECNYAVAYKYFLESALKGEPGAVVNLGYMYLHGNYVKVDYEKAFHCFKEFYDMTGSLEPMIDVVTNDSNIVGCADGREAFRGYLDFLIEKGEWNALINKADEIKKGKVYPRDGKKCVECCEEAIAHGVKMGAEYLGELYFLGDMVEQDYEKALHYFNMFDGSVSFTKPYYLGEMYRIGKGMEKDISKAIECYKYITESDESWAWEDDYYQLSKKRLKELGEA